MLSFTAKFVENEERVDIGCIWVLNGIVKSIKILISCVMGNGVMLYKNQELE